MLPTKTPITPAILNSNEISMNHQEGDFLPKHSPSFLKPDSSYIVSDVDVNTNSIGSSAGGYRRSPISCQSVEEESVRSSSSRVGVYFYTMFCCNNILDTTFSFNYYKCIYQMLMKDTLIFYVKQLCPISVILICQIIFNYKSKPVQFRLGLRYHF